MPNQPTHNFIGLTDYEVQKRIQNHQVNVVSGQMTKSTEQIIRDNTFTWFNFFNFGIAFALILVQSYKNVFFMVVILINLFIGIIQELRSKHELEKLSLLAIPHVNVIRNSVQSQIRMDEIVLDDWIILKAGDQISSDSVVMEGFVEVNEALLTGEMDAVMKRVGDHLLSSSFVVSGACYSQVEHIGNDNYAIQITQEAKKYKKLNSSLLNSLNRIVKFTSYFILPFGVLMFLDSFYIQHLSFNESVIADTAALLGLLPKGLVLLATLSLVIAVIKLARKKTLVQELFSIETLSRVDTLCLDKTGTLTEGIMQIENVIDFGLLDIPLEDVMGSILYNSQDTNATYLAMKERFPMNSNYFATHHIPFSSDRKWSNMTLSELGTFFIGAYDVLLPEIDVIPLEIRRLEEDGKRLILLAHCPDMNVNEPTKTLQPVAIFILQDKIRENAKEILDYFKQQDVTVKIISGDSPRTVSSIARQAGVENYDLCVDATSLISIEDIENAVDRYTIFGRVLPKQKKEIILALKKHGHTVAMTGDGINDVLALKEADCSIAIGSGSDAARQVSQLILLDSDFSVLPSIVAEGRRVVNNITRTASLFLVKTIYTFLLTLLTILLRIAYPFVPIQISLISLFVEAIPAFFLAFEPNNERVKENFMKTVLTNAIPSGLIIVSNIMLIHFLVVPTLHLVAIEATTLDVYVMGFAWLMQLFHVCRPFNKVHALLWGSMVICFYMGSYLFRGLLGLSILSQPSLLVFAFLALVCYPIQLILTKLIGLFGKKTEF